MPLLTDLREVKSILEISEEDTTEDKKLLFLMEWATQWIEEWLNRVGRIFIKSRTEYYNGTGTQGLLLRSRPAYRTPTITVLVDEAGFFGAPSGSFDTNTTALTYGDHFALQLDQDDNLTSRSGILIRINDLWPKPPLRQQGYLYPFAARSFGNIKITYTAGYTVDNLPATLRMAANLLVARMRDVLPLGYELVGESYEERTISRVISEKNKLLGMVAPMLANYRNWRF